MFLSCFYMFLPSIIAIYLLQVLVETTRTPAVQAYTRLWESEWCHSRWSWEGDYPREVPVSLVCENQPTIGFGEDMRGYICSWTDICSWMGWCQLAANIYIYKFITGEALWWRSFAIWLFHGELPWSNEWMVCPRSCYLRWGAMRCTSAPWYWYLPILPVPVPAVPQGAWSGEIPWRSQRTIRQLLSVIIIHPQVKGII